jgi:squalene-hopene/tetraprenyl-beta-curcumene cyclase
MDLPLNAPLRFNTLFVRNISKTLSESRIEGALRTARATLLKARARDGFWIGNLSPSALATATAVVALILAEKALPQRDRKREQLIEDGLAWLAAHINSDGGWGDTVDCRSNLSTTTLVWAAFGAWPNAAGAHGKSIAAAERWLGSRVGKLSPENLAAKILERYASDRTFSVPILTLCAFAGRLGSGPEAWSQVIPLPFELSIFPPRCFAALHLPVVSYALPALIAVGYARHYHAPPKNPLIRAIRNMARDRALGVLASIQPPNGGFLEAIPLTSFVVMSLAASGQADHPVTRRGLEFIVNSALPDGSWKIDTNLATWVTTLSIHSLSSAQNLALEEHEKLAVCDWLLGQQYRKRHPYTNAAPGGWAWTDLPGGVPDADDTAGALLALKNLGVREPETLAAAEAGVRWLLDLQNSDGGIPTFCRGWGNLPFDRSSADLTAHSLRAWAAWKAQLPEGVRRRIQVSTGRALRFLRNTQEPGGAWCPLWFGNEHERDESNRVYGTSRVLLALADTGLDPDGEVRAIQWLVSAQKGDGGWSGGDAAAASSVEETALAVEAISAVLESGRVTSKELRSCLEIGVAWLTDRIEQGTWKRPSPIGFYFAKLWYHEELYPVLFTVTAMGRAVRVMNGRI